MSAVHFILYSRSYCHLCEEMMQALQKFHERYAFTIEQIDVDADEGLTTLYDELVPVLTARNSKGTSVQLCHYFLDVPRVEAFLMGAEY